jgi:hypothetical protein
MWSGGGSDWWPGWGSGSCSLPLSVPLSEKWSGPSINRKRKPLLPTPGERVCAGGVCGCTSRRSGAGGRVVGCGGEVGSGVAEAAVSAAVAAVSVGGVFLGMTKPTCGDGAMGGHSKEGTWST